MPGFPAMGPQKVSLPLLQVLDLLLSTSSRDDWYGLAVGRETGLASGTVTQILFRLEQWGWIVYRWEDRAEAYADGRPPRRFFRLTGMGEQAARDLLKDRQQRIIRWQTHRGGLA